MKFYFSGSIRSGRENQELYKNIINYLKNFGKVLSAHIGDKNLTSAGETSLKDEEIYKRDIKWIKEADAVIAEVSIPALGIGYELCKAESLGKPVLCLYRVQENKRLSAMIAGNKNFSVKQYKTFEEACRHIDSFLKKLKKN